MLIFIGAIFNLVSKRAQLNTLFIINMLRTAKIPYVVIEHAVYGKPFFLAESESIIHVRTNSSMWYKEQLYNFAAKRLDKKYTKFMFLDMDIIFKDMELQEVYNAISTKLDIYDIVQPYRIVEYLASNNNTVLQNKIGTVATLEDCDSKVSKQSILGKTSPGFTIAIKRSTFASMGGFFDKSLFGGGDFALMCALYLPMTEIVSNIKYVFIKSIPEDKYKEYCISVAHLKPSISYMDYTIQHLWHGSLQKRQYTLRHKTLVFDACDVQVLENGLYEYSKESSELFLNYMSGRDQDSPTTQEEYNSFTKYA